MQRAKRAGFTWIGGFLGCVVCLLLITASATAQDVLISEIAWSGSAENASHEWIELRSLSARETDLTGWRLVSEDGYPSILLSGVIPPFGYYLLERETDESIPCFAADLIYSGALRDSGETLRLFDNTGELVDIANPGGGEWPAGTSPLDAPPFSTMERVLPGLASVSPSWQTYRRDLDIDEPPCVTILGTPGRENSVENALPIAAFTITPNPAHPGEPVMLDAGTSIDPSGEIRSYEWLVGGQRIDPGQTASVVFEQEGVAMVTLTVTDWKGTSESATGTVRVAWNSAPTADFSVGTQASNRALVSLDTLEFIDESTDVDGTIVSWEWDFGDGSVSHEQRPGHAYSESGVYTVTLDVWDDRGDSARATQPVTIANLLPVARFSLPTCTVTEGDVAVLDASPSFDLDGTPSVYRWDFDSNGEFDLIQTGSAMAEHPFTGGAHRITLQVQDDRGGLSLPVTDILTINRPPVPNFAVSCPAPSQCQEITFNGTFSSDPDGVVESWAWSLGNGRRASGAQTTAMYESPGTYTVGLTVVDDAGISRTLTQQIAISDLPPEAMIAVSHAERPTGSTFSFDAQGSVDPCHGSIVLYEWDLDGDGAYETSGASPTASRTFDDNGRGTASVRVTDCAGNMSTSSVSFTVTNRPPTCCFSVTPTAPADGEEVMFAAQATDPDGEVASICWSFGDGTHATGGSAVHPFPDDAVYTVTLTVTDDDGCTTSCSQTVDVDNAPPISAFEIEQSSARIGDEIQFTSLAYDPSPNGRIVHVAWDFGDGAVTTGRPAGSSTTNILSPLHAYNHSGTFVVSLAVIDENGSLSIASQVVTILE